MRSFDLEASLNMRVVVPEQFVVAMREYATEFEATPFLKRAQELYPEDDDEFILFIIKHGVRHEIRDAVSKLFVSSGLGGSISPTKAEGRSRVPPPEGAEPVLASEVV